MQDLTGAEDAPDPQHRDQETQDRELDELSSELRMVIPAVTVLLAFLLTIPFAAGFTALSQRQEAAYFVAFLTSALALILLLGEGAYHQIRGKPYDKGLLLKTATRQTVAALVLLVVALCAVVFLITDVLYGTAISAPLAAGVTLFAAGTWFGIPLLRRMRSDR